MVERPASGKSSIFCSCESWLLSPTSHGHSGVVSQDLDLTLSREIPERSGEDLCGGSRLGMNNSVVPNHDVTIGAFLQLSTAGGLSFPTPHKYCTCCFQSNLWSIAGNCKACFCISFPKASVYGVCGAFRLPQVVRGNGVAYSADNRRLWTFKHSGMKGHTRDLASWFSGLEGATLDRHVDVGFGQVNSQRGWISGSSEPNTQGIPVFKKRTAALGVLLFGECSRHTSLGVFQGRNWLLQREQTCESKATL